MKPQKHKFASLQVPALLKSISLFLWQSSSAIIVFYYIFAFRKFAISKTKSYIDEMERRVKYYLKNLKIIRNNSVGISPPEMQQQDIICI